MIVSVAANPSIDYNIQVDELVRNEVAKTAGALLFPGGGGVYVGRAVKRLGDVPVTVLGLAGGHLGSLLKSMLDQEEVAHDFIDTGEEVRLNVLITLKPDRSLVRVNAAGPEAEEKLGEALLKKIAGATPTPKIVVLSGSLPGRKLPPGISRDLYGRIIDELKKKPEVKVILDSRDLELGHGLDRGPWLVKPNEREMQHLVKRTLDSDGDYIKAADELIGRYGVEYFVISRAAAGCLVVGKNARYKVTPPETVSTRRVGAGDVFVGGLAWALAKDEPIDVAAKYAVTVGTAMISSPANGLFRKEEVEKLLPKTGVEKL